MALSLIDDVLPEDIFEANGLDRDFGLSWKARQEAHVSVQFLTDTSSGSAPEDPDIAFVLENVDDPDSNLRLVFDEAPQEGTIIIARLEMPIARTTDYTQNNAFRATVVNGEQVDQILIDQQINRETRRALRLSPGDSLSNTNPTLPPYLPGHGFYWSKTQRRIVSVSIDTLNGSDGVDGEDATRPDGIFYADDIALAGDGVTDDSSKLSLFMLTRSEAGQYTTVVLYSDLGFYFSQRLRIPTNVNLVIACPIYGSPQAGYFVSGNLREADEKPRIASAVAIGATTAVIDTTALGGVPVSSLIGVNRTVVFRGENDIAGNAVQQDTVRITNVNDGTNTITFTPALNFAYQPSYGQNAYAQLIGATEDRTTVSIVVGSVLSADVDIGDSFVTVPSAAVGRFAVGDMVEIQDDQLTASNNPLGIEPNKIIGIDLDGSNTLRLQHKVGRPFTTANNVAIQVVDPVRNVTLTGANMTWRATASSSLRRHMVEVNYGMDCVVRGGQSLNAGVHGNRGNGFRITRSLNCVTDQCKTVNPKHIGSAEGYGAAIYYSRNCAHLNFTGTSCRHTVLFQGGTANYADNITSIDCAQADIDFHGIGEYGCWAENVLVEGGPTFSAGTRAAFVFGNTAHGGPTVNCSVTGFKVRNYNGSSTRVIKFQPGSEKNIVSNGECHNISTLVHHSDTTSFPSLIQDKNTVSDVIVHNCTDWVVDIDGGTNGSSTRTCSDLMMRNLTLRDCTKLFKVHQAIGVKVRNTEIENDDTTVDASNPYIADVNDCPGFHWRGGYSLGCAKGFKIQDSENARVVGHSFEDHSSTEVLFDAGGSDGLIWHNNFPVDFTPTADVSGASSVTYFPFDIGSDYLTT